MNESQVVYVAPPPPSPPPVKEVIISTSPASPPPPPPQDPFASPAPLRDTTPPSFERFTPDGPVFIKYGQNLISDGRTPFRVCGDDAAVTAARNQKKAGQTSAHEYPCALAINDDKDDPQLYQTAAGDRAQYYRIQLEGEALYQLDLIGAGGAAPGQYHYKYVAWDSSGNQATHPLVINVGLESANLSVPITVTTATFESPTYIADLKTEQAGYMAAALPTWQMFFGAKDIEVVNVETAGSNTNFQLYTTFYQLWNPADPTTFDVNLDWNTTDAWAETSGGVRVRARRRHQRGRHRVGGVGRAVVGERSRGEGARGGPLRSERRPRDGRASSESD